MNKSGFFYKVFTILLVCLIIAAFAFSIIFPIVNKIKNRKKYNHSQRAIDAEEYYDYDSSKEYHAFCEGYDAAYEEIMETFDEAAEDAWDLSGKEERAYDAGYGDGYIDGSIDGEDEGYRNGYGAGYEEGYEQGYIDCKDDHDIVE